MEDEVIEYQGIHNRKEVEFAIHSLSGKLVHSTIKLKGTFRGEELTILLDGESRTQFCEA